MHKKQVTAMVPASEKKGTKQLGPVTITVECGETAKENIELFGDEAVNSNAMSNWVVTLQSGIRSALKSGLDAAAIQAKLGTARMGVAMKGGRVDPQQAYIAMFASATPEKQAEMLKDLKERAAEIAKGK